MYDLISHLIYLDNFSEKKTNNTSLGRRNSLLPQIARLFSAPSWLSSGESRGRPPLPAPGAWLRGEASEQLFLGCARPTEGCQIDELLDGRELPNVFLRNVSALNDRDPRQFTVTSIFFNEV